MKTSYFFLRQYVDHKDGFKCFFKGISVPPLSPYQESLIEQISELRSNGWNNSQIAKLFNEKGMPNTREKDFHINSYLVHNELYKVDTNNKNYKVMTW